MCFIDLRGAEWRDGCSGSFHRPPWMCFIDLLVRASTHHVTSNDSRILTLPPSALIAVVEVVREVPVEIVREVPVYIKIDPAEWDARHGLTVQNRSQFGGVGMLLGKFEGNHERAGYIYVLEIVPGTPAASCADIDLQDILTHVEGKVVTGMPLSTVHQMIRGPEGTPVALEFIRHHSGERINVTLYRMAAVSEGSAVYTGQVNSVKVTSAGFRPHDGTRSSYARSGAYDHAEVEEERQRAYL